MLEDKLLVWKLKKGNPDALGRIYRKYKDNLLALALSLSHDRSIAEDVVHDAFVSFAEQVTKLQLRGSLKSYLSSCVANRIRGLYRDKPNEVVSLLGHDMPGPHTGQPEIQVISNEQHKSIEKALGQLPYPQRAVVILHLQEGKRFKAIADLQDIPINTVQSRYRYGLDKLRTLLNGKVER
jgi:RNA polymerase sigma factor (sigma-70 family)